jgi:predicted nucleic acid-binding protein
MPERIICNTSPLFYLHRVGHLELLPKLYGSITVPDAVVAELRAGRDQGEDAPEPSAMAWIEVCPVRVPQLIALINDFGPGEAEVLALALEHPGSLVIVDDRLAQTIAKGRGLRVTGTAGVLLKAKREGHLPAVAPVLSELTRLGFRRAPATRQEILALADETTPTLQT